MSYSIRRNMGKKVYVHEDADRGVVEYLTVDEAAYDLSKLHDTDEDNSYTIYDNDTEKRVDPNVVLLACLNSGYEPQKHSEEQDHKIDG